MKIVGISLARETQRRERLLTLMKKLSSLSGFAYVLFDACDKRDNVTIGELVRNGKNMLRVRNAYHRQLVPGEIGCAMSHLLVLKMLKEEKDCAGYFILEDDTIVSDVDHLIKTMKSIQAEGERIQFVNASSEIRYASPVHTQSVNAYLTHIQRKCFNMANAYYISKSTAEKIDTNVITRPMDDRYSTMFERGEIDVLVCTNPVCGTSGDSIIWRGEKVYHVYKKGKSVGERMFEHASLYAICKKRNKTLECYYEDPQDDLRPHFSYCFANDGQGDTVVEPYRIQGSECDPGVFTTERLSYEGNMCNHAYFGDHLPKDEIARIFEFREHIQVQARSLLKGVAGTKVAVRVTNGSHKPTNEFFKRVDSELGGVTFCVFGEETLSLDLTGLRCIRFHSYLLLDMCCMTMCDHFIIDLSPESWWPAWLACAKKTCHVWVVNKVMKGVTAFPVTWNVVRE